MPVQTSPPVPASFPSFMSVFGGDARVEETGRSYNHPITNDQPSGHFLVQQPSSLQSQHSAYQHRGSIASSGTESTDSSPTTTISTFDSISVTASTDPSPSSSPESPTSAAAATAPFKGMLGRPVTAPGEPFHRNGLVKSHTFSQSLPQPDSPGSKARNVKNLSLSVLPNASDSSTASSGPDSSHPLSAPTSPLRAPLRTGRRKPHNLTIQTPGFDKISFGVPSQALVPPTPAGRPSLRHFESSPSLPSIFSPTTAPHGGMHFPKPACGHLVSEHGYERSSFSKQSSLEPTIKETQEVDASHVPKSQETSERGYTSGPVCIYDSGLYLYLEPTEEEASKFDVIINVAKEVKNPFSADSAKLRPSVMSVWRRGEHALNRLSTSEPQTAMSEKSFKSAFEWPSMDAPTPSQPSHKAGPEYIHVPWDHNSEILDDLEPLCQLIDSRINAGKSILVHCQLGVSRSASLVIAYGLYKKYHADFHSMYSAVKERSRWVGPNMSLIYQLMDFRAKLSRNHTSDGTMVNMATIGFKSTESEKTPKAQNGAALASPPPIPQAPRMVSSGTQTDFEPLYSLRPAPESMQTLASATFGSTTALSSVSDGSQSLEGNSKAAKRATPRPFPLREVPFSAPPEPEPFKKPDISPHNPLPLSDTPEFTRPTHIDLVMQDVPPTPSLFSPRATEFMAWPFPRSIAGDLAFTRRPSSVHIPGSWPKLMEESTAHLPEDPRSPPQAGQGHEIIRSIDDLL